MIKNFIESRIYKFSPILIALPITLSGCGVQTESVSFSPSDRNLFCVDSKTTVVTRPGTSICPDGGTSLVLGAKGEPGIIGLTGAVGPAGADGKVGNTIWSGEIDPERSLGAPGDFFINSSTRTLFGPKDLTNGWPSGVSLVGPVGPQGPAGEVGPAGISIVGPVGPQGPAGEVGPAGISIVGPIGPQGPAGSAGSNGLNITLKITELSLCDGLDNDSVADEICKVGMTGPGGGIVFFVDYDDLYAGVNYLEVAPQGWGDGITVNQGVTGETTGTKTVDPLMKWCSSPATLVNSNLWSNAGVGNGAVNTNAADSTCSGGAIQASADYSGGGKTDWFLPSIGEAMLMYDAMRQLGVGGFMLSPYWTSSESAKDNAWRQYFNNGDQTNNAKNTTDYVRPIRAF